ncbi:hypothetical protein MAM1_0397c10301 [Mucor ambiguus]|uniref:Uncharacterized protein n=1 Tax=Mucor ambiguus TaxID=91626 RepID=A0A0C9MTL7_9FUNG|nr:hypothetical protein MAM1_0397c10301 [Mucor ambiguus]
MAGNNSKKTTERRDSSVYKQQQQQQRKNSAGGAGAKKDTVVHHQNNTGTNKILNPKAQQAAGAAILSAVTSPQPSGLAQAQQQSVGANGFNRGELVEFLNMRNVYTLDGSGRHGILNVLDIGFSDVLTAYQNTNLDPKMRPEKYESAKPTTTSAWGKSSTGVPSAWGQQQSQAKDSNGVMANGSDFLSELNKKF